MGGISADGSAIFFRTTELLAPDAVPGPSHLYRWRNGRVELVGRDEQGGALAGGSRLGGGGTSVVPASGNAGHLPESDAVSEDGLRFAYGGSNGGPRQVYLRLRDGSTVLASASQRSGSVGQESPMDADFVAGANDMETVFFRSEAQLTDSAPVGGGDYRFDATTGVLSYLTPDDSLPPLSASIGGIARVSKDAKYMYFVSRTPLAPGAMAGEPNFYVSSENRVVLIARLDASDDGMTVTSGAGGFAPSPSFTTTALNGDGSQIVFQTRARVLDYDNDGRVQVYKYDARSGRLSCVSCVRSEGVATGDAKITADSDFNLATRRVMSSDGERIVFATTEALVDVDTNGVQDIYERSGNVVSLVSSGSSHAPASLVGISGDGEHVLFTTASSLVPEDIDGGLVDIYDARLSSVPTRAPSAQPCAGDDCQRPPSPRREIEVPGSSVVETNVVEAPSSRFPLRILRVGTATRVMRTGRLEARILGEPGSRVRFVVRASVNGRTLFKSRSHVRVMPRSGRVRVSVRLGRQVISVARTGRLVTVNLTVIGGATRSSARVVLGRQRGLVRADRGVQTSR